MHAGCTHAGCTHKKKRGPCPATYSREVQAALIKVWEMFDYPCGQRLAPALRQEIERLRKAKELVCSEDVAGGIEKNFAEALDPGLAREGGFRGVVEKRRTTRFPPLYAKDRRERGAGVGAA